MSATGTDARAYRALREGVGAYRLAIDAVSVGGPDASEYLQGQLSQDLAPIEVGGSAPALLLEPDGKLCALVRATRTGEQDWVLDCDAGYGEQVRARLARFTLRTKVTIEALDWGGVALRGAGAGPALEAAGAPASGAGGGPPWTVPVEWNGTLGADLLGPGSDDLVPAAALWCTEAAWEALRVEAGIPKMGAELDERTIAAEAGLVGRTVSLTKGCYTGQELVARLDARGSRVARRLCGVVADGLGPQDAAALVGAPLWAPGRERPAGHVTSAAWCVGLDAVGGLAYVHRSVEVPAALSWSPSEDSGPGERRPVGARALPLVPG